MSGLQSVITKDLFSLPVHLMSLDVVLGNPLENAKRIEAAVREVLGEDEFSSSKTSSSEMTDSLIAFQALTLTGSTCASLFLDDSFLQKTYDALSRLCNNLRTSSIVFVGLPLKVEGNLYNCVVGMRGGKILFIQALPKDESEPSPFKDYRGDVRYIDSRQLFNKCVDKYFENHDGAEYYNGEKIPFQSSILLGLELKDGCSGMNRTLKVGFASDSSILDSQFYDVCFLFSSSPFVLKDYDEQNEIAKAFSKVCGNAILSSSPSHTETSPNWVYSSGVVAFESGECIDWDSMLKNKDSYVGEDNYFTDIFVELDIERIWKKRVERFLPYKTVSLVASFDSIAHSSNIRSPFPFISSLNIPSVLEIEAYIERLFDMVGLAVRTHIKQIGIGRCVLGLSGGIDSTMALLFLAHSLPKDNIYAFTLPCFGTTDKLKQNAISLCNLLGCYIKEIDIKDSVLQHFKDIGQDSSCYNVTFENAQARERCQVLMDKANMLGAIFIGSSDLSEIALGFSTYAGDHMSMYNILGSIPKTALRLALRYVANHPSLFVLEEDKKKLFSEIINLVLDSPISPELLPPEEGRIVQQTEKILGSYILHDFFMYHIFQNHYCAKKVLYCALKVFGYIYSEEEILEQLKLFYKKFFENQFKRNCAPECPNVTGLSFANWHLPSTIGSALYLEELDALSSYALDYSYYDSEVPYVEGLYKPINPYEELEKKGYWSVSKKTY